ncbi:hypothetical protein FVE85_2811 [Porphyridium purpureum]|uniref:Uncharacterized protein n=1 Tax=Porphyridium purpureum TaxID=35688 RepID=A0A5J4YUF8_PORPP|nr:hypothetical protein FVE85_2811 [Porphyridium purpureum]|eukprot:POR8803..scf227_4
MRVSTTHRAATGGTPDTGGKGEGRTLRRWLRQREALVRRVVQVLRREYGEAREQVQEELASLDAIVAGEAQNDKVRVERLVVPNAATSLGLPPWESRVKERVLQSLVGDRTDETLLVWEQLEKLVEKDVCALERVVCSMLEGDDHFDDDAHVRATLALAQLLEVAHFGVLSEQQYAMQPASTSQESQAADEIQKVKKTRILLDFGKTDASVLENAGHGTAMQHSVFAPHYAIWWRSLAVEKKYGMLVGQKLGIFEGSLAVRWRSQVDSLILCAIGQMTKNRLLSPLAIKRRAGKGASSDLELERLSAPTHSDDVQVARVFPNPFWDAGLKRVYRLFFPAFSREPCFQLLVTFRFAAEKTSWAAEETAVNWQSEGADQAGLDVAKRPRTVEERKPKQTRKYPDLRLFRMVPWDDVEGCLADYYAIPYTADLLRVDLLSLGGLVAAVFAYVNQSSDTLVILSVLLAIARYGWKIRSVLSKSARDRELLVMGKAYERLYATGVPAVRYISALACEQESFVTCLVYVVLHFPEFGFAGKPLDRVDSSAVAGSVNDILRERLGVPSSRVRLEAIERCIERVASLT